MRTVAPCLWLQHQQKMQEASVMASNRNQLASFTVEVLELVTRDLQAPFVLPAMVDRISAMLNYVLKQLVGPNRRQLHVRLQRVQGTLSRVSPHSRLLVVAISRYVYIAWNINT